MSQPRRRSTGRGPAASLDPGRHVLIAGPTASGKSALALDIAETQGGTIVNADALQVYRRWRILTARPCPEEEARAPHRLYGHVGHEEPYSVGHWLREVSDLLQTEERLIFVGGTGLYFRALTEGLVELPETPAEIRAEADRRRAQQGVAAMAAELDGSTRARIDLSNPMRVQRAWEVQRATGRGLAAWQDETPPPLLPRWEAEAIVLEIPVGRLDTQIAQRFARMLEEGALEEVRRELPRWDPALPSARAIGAAELVAHLRGEMTLEEATAAATRATRQYAKRQRTWFRNRMKDWHRIAMTA